MIYSNSHSILKCSQIIFFSGNIITNILISFSLVKNTRAIFSTTVPRGIITSVNGIRTISMTWVILGHLYFFMIISGQSMGMWSSFKLVLFVYFVCSVESVIIITIGVVSSISYSTLEYRIIAPLSQFRPRFLIFQNFSNPHF